MNREIMSITWIFLFYAFYHKNNFYHLKRHDPATRQKRCHNTPLYIGTDGGYQTLFPDFIQTFFPTKTCKLMSRRSPI